MSSSARRDALAQDFDWSWARTDTDWVPPAIDTTQLSAARIYDYLLDGKDNFEADRAAAQQLLKAVPHARQLARANRNFLHHAVRHLVRDHGIRQIIDLGTGFPTSLNVHETARAEAPGVRVLYLDYDPVVVAHSRAILATDPGIVTLLRDLREPHTILDDPSVHEIIDFDQPVGLLFVAVLHFVAVEQTPALLARYRQAVAPGSGLAVSVLCREHSDDLALRVTEKLYRNSDSPLHVRSITQVKQLFEGFQLEAPPAPISEWGDRPDPLGPLPTGSAAFPPMPAGSLAGVGIKR